jgi:membrane fusion protein, multidrug efflux system
METHEDPVWLARVGRVTGLAIILAAVFLVVWVSHIGYRRPRTDDAVVRANVVGIAPHVSGPIVELNVVDNQAVKEGELLFVIDARPFEAELAGAQAQLLLARTQVEALQSSVTAASASLQRLEPEASFAAAHAQRLQGLTAEKYVTLDRFDEAQRNVATSRASIVQARAELARQKALLGPHGEENALVAAAEAAVRAAELNVGYCQVRSPFPARIVNLNISQGEYAKQGVEVFALVDTRVWYVMANFQESYLDTIRPGMEVEVALVAYPGRRFKGVVQGLSWAVQPDFEKPSGGLANVRPTLNWVRLAQRVPVRIQLEPPPAEFPYRMGMSAVVTMLGAPGGDGAKARTAP